MGDIRLARSWLEKRARRIRPYVQTVATSLMPIRPGRKHTLPGELVVSLTSYPKRFRTLHLTLRSLLSQDMAPDRLILWLAFDDAAMLPQRISNLQRHGLEIRTCADLRSYTKLVPTLSLCPSAFILIADDDVFYPRDWLRRFVEAYRQSDEVLCQRGRRVSVVDGVLRPFSEWHLIRGSDSGKAILPTGVGGVLYPPGLLPPETTDAGQFMRLCPTNDDLWFFWMTSRRGCTYRTIEPAGDFLSWPKAQRVALWRYNLNAGHIQQQIAALVEAYGLPFVPLASPLEPMAPVHVIASKNGRQPQ